MTWPGVCQYAHAARRGPRWAAIVATPTYRMIGAVQGAGGVEVGGVLRVRVGWAMTRRGALRKAWRHIRG